MGEAPIYLDYNATTPVDPAVAEAMGPYLVDHFGNPSSGHVFGRRTKQAVEDARERVAALIGAAPEGIVFTSGGSESNNMAILGAARARRDDRRHLVASAVEHPAVLAPCRFLEREGCELTLVGVDARGRVDPDRFASAVRDDTALATVMLANNEVGTIQPIRDLAAHAHRQGAWMHTDAAQAVGKIPVDVEDLGVDLLTIAGHKLYAPKGIGALWIREGLDLPALIHGATHENGRRAGTENVLEIVGLGAACRIAGERLDEDMAHARALRSRLWERLRAARPDTVRHGDEANGLANTLSVAFPGAKASALLEALGEEVAASAGAACHGEGVTVSSVLEAMAVPLDLARGTVRFSVGRFTTEDEVDEAVRLLVDELGKGKAG